MLPSTTVTDSPAGRRRAAALLGLMLVLLGLALTLPVVASAFRSGRWSAQGLEATAAPGDVARLDVTRGLPRGSATGWVKQPSGTTDGLNDVACVDALHGWAVGDYNTILATTDGGATWSAQSSGIDKMVSLYGAAFADATHGWAVGGYGTILATGDGGQTWAVQDSGTSEWLHGVAFIDARNG